MPGLKHGLKRAWQAERVAEVLGEPPAKANRGRNMTHACFQWGKLAHANGVPQQSVLLTADAGKRRAALPRKLGEGFHLMWDRRQRAPC